MGVWFIRRANISAGGDVPPTPPQPTEADLTSLFTWTDGAYGSSGNASTTSAAKATFRYSNSVDVSQYTGKTMKVTFMAYNNSTGGQSSFYGLFFYTSGGTKISSSRIPLATGYPNSSGYTDDVEIEIPSNAATFKTTYFKDSVSFTVSAFSCKVVLE